MYDFNQPYSDSDRASLLMNIKDCYRQLDFFQNEDYSNYDEINKNLLHCPSRVFHSTNRLYEANVVKQLIPSDENTSPLLSLDQLYSLTIQHIKDHLHDKVKTLKMLEYFTMKNQKIP